MRFREPAPGPPWLLLLPLLPLLFARAEEGPVVRVAGGAIRGRAVEQPGAPLAKYYAFEGIPYARPPVGERRFKDPEEIEPWDGIKNTTSPGSICIQRDILDSLRIMGEEDCLFINVFTADAPEEWAAQRRAVAVWVHGGAFVVGSGDFQRLRPDALLRQGLVVVSFNYRLGVFGFLNTEDEEAPGNAALKDAVQALRWVQRNVRAFGGDPGRVTVLGESAGAAIVHYLLLTPLTKGLLHGAISMSGNALLSWAFAQRPRANAMALRRHLSAACPDDPADAIARCLRRVDARALAAAHDAAPPPELQFRFWKNPFLPSVEAPAASQAPFLTSEPEQLMRAGHFLKVPYITGFTSAEGILYLKFGKLLEEPARWRDLDARFADAFRHEMPRGLRGDAALAALRRFYMRDRAVGDAGGDAEALRRFLQLTTDLLFAAGAVSSARLMAAGGARVFVYEFTHEGPSAFLKALLYNASHVPGVAHGDDLGYLFDLPRLRALPPPPPADAAVKARRVRLFADFAKTGNPTPETSEGPTWPPYSADEEEYMEMGTNFTIKNHVLGDRISFWRQLASTSETMSVN